MKSSHILVLASSLLGGMACAKKTDSPSDTSAVQVAAPLDTASAPAAAVLNDANIVFILDQANASDSARGTLASTKGSSADVKEFGRMMAGEHHSLRQLGQRLATKLSVTPAAPANDMSIADAQKEMDALNAEAKGKAWDVAYMNFEVTYHKAVLDIATKALGAAQNQELKDLIAQAAPILQKHLDRALAIQAKLGM